MLEWINSIVGGGGILTLLGHQLYRFKDMDEKKVSKEHCATVHAQIIADLKRGDDKFDDIFCELKKISKEQASQSTDLKWIKERLAEK